MKASEFRKLIREEAKKMLKEAAVSKAQQQAAGIALSVKRGDAPASKLKDAGKAMVKMSEKELEKIAGTKTTELPKKVKKKVNEAEETAPVAPSGDRSLEILDKIKKLTKALQKQQTIRNNAAAQRLNAKFTGMLGKMTSYINQQLTPETPEESGEENV